MEGSGGQEEEGLPFNVICTASQDGHLAVLVLWWIPRKLAFCINSAKITLDLVLSEFTEP